MEIRTVPLDVRDVLLKCEMDLLLGADVVHDGKGQFSGRSWIMLLLYYYNPHRLTNSK